MGVLNSPLIPGESERGRANRLRREKRIAAGLPVRERPTPPAVPGESKGDRGRRLAREIDAKNRPLGPKKKTGRPLDPPLLPGESMRERRNKLWKIKADLKSEEELAARRQKVNESRRKTFTGDGKYSKPRSPVIPGESGAERRNRLRREQDIKDPSFSRKLRLEQKYGLSAEDAEKMFEAQGGLCFVCLLPMCLCVRNGCKGHRCKNRACVDHCHDCGAVRGLSHGLCNSGMGQLRDDPETLRRAADFLEAHMKTNKHISFKK